MLRAAREIKSLKHVSFVSHGAGGLVARYAARLLLDRGVLGGSLAPVNFLFALALQAFSDAIKPDMDHPTL